MMSTLSDPELTLGNHVVRGLVGVANLINRFALGGIKFSLGDREVIRTVVESLADLVEKDEFFRDG